MERDKTGESSKFKGVVFIKRDNSWMARIVFNDKVHNLGRFDEEEDAAAAYNLKAVELFGEFASLNDLSEYEIDYEKIKDRIGNSKRHRHSSSRFLGVATKGKSRWRAYITYNRQTKYIGTFTNEKEAAIAYNKEAILIFGDKAKLNVIE